MHQFFVDLVRLCVYIYSSSEKSFFEIFIASGVQKYFGNILSSYINTFSSRKNKRFFFSWKETFHLQGLVSVHIYKNTQKSSEAARNSSNICIETAKINFQN